MDSDTTANGNEDAPCVSIRFGLTNQDLSVYAYIRADRRLYTQFYAVVVGLDPNGHPYVTLSYLGSSCADDIPEQQFIELGHLIRLSEEGWARPIKTPAGQQSGSGHQSAHHDLRSAAGRAADNSDTRGATAGVPAGGGEPGAMPDAKPVVHTHGHWHGNEAHSHSHRHAAGEHPDSGNARHLLEPHPHKHFAR